LHGTSRNVQEEALRTSRRTLNFKPIRSRRMRCLHISGCAFALRNKSTIFHASTMDGLWPMAPTTWFALYVDLCAVKPMTAGPLRWYVLVKSVEISSNNASYITREILLFQGMTYCIYIFLQLKFSVRSGDTRGF